MTSERAPKGGITVAGVFYKGGQFLPSNNEPKRGKFNGSKSVSIKARKVEVAPYQWDYAPEGKRSLYTWIAGTVARRNGDNLEYSANAQILNYMGMSEETAKSLVAQYNQGVRWV